jgi:hypothetical protein
MVHARPRRVGFFRIGPDRSPGGREAKQHYSNGNPPDRLARGSQSRACRPVGLGRRTASRKTTTNLLFTWQACSGRRVATPTWERRSLAISSSRTRAPLDEFMPEAIPNPIVDRLTTLIWSPPQAIPPHSPTPLAARGEVPRANGRGRSTGHGLAVLLAVPGKTPCAIATNQLYAARSRQSAVVIALNSHIDHRRTPRHRPGTIQCPQLQAHREHGRDSPGDQSWAPCGDIQG